MSKVQSVLFRKENYTAEDAIKWLFANGFNVKKIDGTKNLWRFRQYSPSQMRKEGLHHYANKEIAKGLSLVIAY